MASSIKAAHDEVLRFLAEMDDATVSPTGANGASATDPPPPGGAVEILTGKLWQASAMACDRLKVERPTTPWAIISLQDAPDDDGAPLRPAIHWPMQDVLAMPDESILRLVALWGLDAIEAGRVLVVQCGAGRNRSGLVCGLISRSSASPILSRPSAPRILWR